MHLCNLESWVQLQALTKVESGFLVFLEGLVDLPEGEVLEPGVVLGGFHVEGALSEKDGVIIEL